MKCPGTIKKFTTSFKCMLLILLFGCSGARYLERTNRVEQAYNENDFQKAFATAEEIIRDLPGKQKPEYGKVFALAGNSAYELGKYERSLEYLEKALRLDYTGESMYLNLAALYQRIDNLSKEIEILESYIRLFPEGKEMSRVRERLFMTCRESMNYDLAMNLWPLLDDASRSEITNLELYLEINQVLENDSICEATAEKILGLNEVNETALKWFAEKYYWKAENRYQSELDAYNRNKTHKQYNLLLNAFKKVTSDFKESLEYFTRLYRLYPDPGYARYLGNIYARLNNEEKARYYHSKAR